MQWLNKPAEVKLAAGRLAVRSDTMTDFWRKTHDDGVRHNGHFYFESVDGDFTARVKVTGDYASQYDQAGIMVQVDEQTWLKCGIELMDGQQYASAVVTRQWSDWSICPVPNPTAVWIQCERKKTTFSVSYSLDGVAYQMIRQTFLSEQSVQGVGMMLASPKGEGFNVLFEDYTLTAYGQ